MKIETTRFGAIECPAEQTVVFPRGLIGFYDEHEFIVVPHGESELIAWLQSTKTPALAFPIVSAHAFAPDYPDVNIQPAAQSAGIEAEADGYAMMVILSAPQGQPATVNLLAPLVVNAATRRGAQVILDNTRYSARELFVLPQAVVAKPAVAAAQPAG
jgi:flagellar assembly factor FliW